MVHRYESSPIRELTGVFIDKAIEVIECSLSLILCSCIYQLREGLEAEITKQAGPVGPAAYVLSGSGRSWYGRRSRRLFRVGGTSVDGQRIEDAVSVFLYGFAFGLNVIFLFFQRT
jgi:hypothetical protein